MIRIFAVVQLGIGLDLPGSSRASMFGRYLPKRQSQGRREKHLPLWPAHFKGRATPSTELVKEEKCDFNGRILWGNYIVKLS